MGAMSPSKQPWFYSVPQQRQIFLMVYSKIPTLTVCYGKVCQSMDIRRHWCLLGELVEKRIVVGQNCIPFSNSCNYNLKNSYDWTPHRLLHPVFTWAQQEACNGQRDEQSWEPEANCPPVVILHPHNRGARDEAADVDCEEEPVKEGILLQPLSLAGAIELVSAERRDAWLYATCSYGHHVEAKEEHNRLRWTTLQERCWNRHCSHPLVLYKNDNHKHELVRCCF